MSRYLATVNTPGYMPWDDDPPVFDTAQEAWGYLYGERVQLEEDVADVNGDEDAQFSETVEELRQYANRPDVADMTGTAYGSNPDCDPTHDLGLAYTVTEVEEN